MSPRTPGPLTPWGIALRVAVLIAVIGGATWVAKEVQVALDLTIRPETEQAVPWALGLGLGAYAILLAIPFVPGAEIGIALLTVFGSAIAPLIYATTVLAMTLAYLVGRLLPDLLLVRLLRGLGLDRAAGLVQRAMPLSCEDRVALLMEGAPPRLLAIALRHRYVALALAVNTPGNSVIGGGGGIMVLAGLSGVFQPLPTVLTLLIAVSPVPIAVLAFGGL